VNPNITNCSSDTWEKLLFVIVGWVLATASPLIADYFRRRREIGETKAALLAELRELKYRLAVVILRIESELGQLNQKLLTWIQPVFEGYTGPLPSKSIQDFIEQGQNWTDAQIAELNVHMKKPSGSALHIKSYPAPFLDSRLKNVGWLPINLQALLLEIHTQLTIFDAEREQLSTFFKLSFSATGQNLANIHTNIDAAHNNLSKVASTIVQRIVDLERAWR
jgi:hypothetical protein